MLVLLNLQRELQSSNVEALCYDLLYMVVSSGKILRQARTPFVFRGISCKVLCFILNSKSYTSEIRDVQGVPYKYTNIFEMSNTAILFLLPKNIA